MFLRSTCTDILFCCLYSNERVGKVTLDFLHDKSIYFAWNDGTHTKIRYIVKNVNLKKVNKLVFVHSSSWS